MRSQQEYPCVEWGGCGGTSGYPHPRCFGVKSAEAVEKKRVEFLRVPKSAQQCEKKELE